MNIRGEGGKCPLCGAATMPTVTENGAHDYGEVFPRVPTIMRQYNLILRTAEINRPGGYPGRCAKSIKKTYKPLAKTAG